MPEHARASAKDGDAAHSKRWNAHQKIDRRPQPVAGRFSDIVADSAPSLIYIISLNACVLP
jgi:hypothetical protein